MKSIVLACSIMLLSMCTVVAQECNGSFGDPVFDETFGNNAATGSDFAGALPSGTTNYTYATTDTQDGYYTITTNPNLALSSLFSTTDHTDDEEGEGYMLVVNADENSTGEFYRTSVTGLCNSLVYQFSAYFLNALPLNGACSDPVPCNIKFVIEDEDGNELGSVETGDIDSINSINWVNYSFEFVMPDGDDSVSVVLINNALGGCGNDLAIDDITFRACGSLATVSTDYEDFDAGICPNETVTFTADIDESAYTNPAYQWQISTDGGDTWTDISGETSTSVTITGFSENELVRYLVYEAENIDSPNCQIASEAMEVVIYETPANEPSDLEACDQEQNGTAVFDLTSVETVLLGGANAEDFTISYHTSESNAENNTAAISTPEAYENTSVGETIYVRVYNIEKGCSNVTSFQLLLNDLPEVNSPVTLHQCDDDTDGISEFNLEEALGFITDEDLEFTFYKTEAAAWSEDSALDIPNPTSFGNYTYNTVYVTAKNELGCFAVAEIQLVVSVSQIPDSYTATLEVCDSDADGDADNGVETFNLNSVTNDILALFSDSESLEVTYYTSEADALAEMNEVGPSFTNTDSPYEEWLYVRIDNATDNSCFGLKKCVQLLVNSLPVFEVTTPQQICLNDVPKTLSVENAQGNYSYTWYDPSGAIISTSSTAQATEAGNFTIVASTSTSDNACEQEATITLTASNVPETVEISIEDGHRNNTITVNVTGIGNYEYSIDGENYQVSPVFDDLDGGSYTVYIRDKNGCGVVTDEVCIIAFPPYFTPNGDGINDVWMPQNANSDCGQDAVIYIFDRYGQLLSQITTGEGWDGTYKGETLPATDYWFKVALPNRNNESFTGHFAMKR
ncbi:gliding motility-associated C-terminal domain-containing protein [Pustulibacterium marinum]|uniref:Gliding motility-associated C-terminal domain-containing protein n=1 Tax=Pustulibacterium marinum TaxID=1224947 RepID=A0A1I7I814_9FLAO|nr:T9SS type B sorting domain-containing protein [Pustulibacterium marinum]SFU69115.1 gliding motility-associated C-terminal domain-containing protein [Pustulibacterium marinum]